MAGAPAGGAELFFERLCVALHEAGETVLPMIRRNPARAGRLLAAGLTVRAFGFRGGWDVATRLGLRAALRREAPSVAVAWMGRAAAAAPAGPWTLVGRLGGYYDLRRFRACRHLVANTKALAAWIAGQGVPAERVHYLPNFAPDLLGAAPAALPVPAGAPVVLALGRLHWVKGFDLLIRAMERVPAAHLVLAGEGEERAALQALAAAVAPGRVHFLGWREDTGGLLAAADVVVCASRSEPLGNTILEAWSAARPVVAARSAGPVELLVEGETGLLVPPEDPAALAGAIGQVLRDAGAARLLGAAGRARYEAGFSVRAVTADWQAFLHRVAG